MKHGSKLGSKLIIDDEINKEIGQVVDEEHVAEVAADWHAIVEGVHDRTWYERDNKDKEKTCSNLH